MKLTLEDKLNICKEHVEEGKSLSHVSERYGKINITGIKYLVSLYKNYGEEPFKNRDRQVYRRDTKLLLINKVKNGESIRKVSLEFGLIDPSILRDWIKKFDNDGEEAIRDTFPRKNYKTEDERYKTNIDKKLQEENERLKAEIDYLKKSQSLARKLEGLTTKEKVKVVMELRTKYKLKVFLEIASVLYRYIITK